MNTRTRVLIGLVLTLGCTSGIPEDPWELHEAALRDLLAGAPVQKGQPIFLYVEGAADPSRHVVTRARAAGWDVVPGSTGRSTAPPLDSTGRPLSLRAALADSAGRVGPMVTIHVTRWINSDRAEVRALFYGLSSLYGFDCVYARVLGQWQKGACGRGWISALPNRGVQPAGWLWAARRSRLARG